MKQKTYEQLEKDNKRLKFMISLLFFVFMLAILFIGTMNINTTKAAKHYESKLSEANAKAKVFEDELYDIKQSGTCLQRIAMFENQ